MEQKEEKNDDIKIIENTINIPCTEKIKNTTIKKESKNKNIIEIKIDKPKFDLTVLNKEKNNVTDNNNKKETKEDIKQEPVKNPFATLFNKESDKDTIKENNKENSIFANIIDNKSKSLFGDIINKDKDKDKDNKDDNNNKKEKTKSLFDFSNKEEKNEKETNIFNQDSIFENQPISNKPSLFENLEGKSLFIHNDDNNNKKKLFKYETALSLFDKNKDNNNNTLFSNNAGKSLFGSNNDNNNKNPPKLFSDLVIPNNPFSEIKGDDFAKSLFNNNNNQKNNNDNKKEKENIFEGDAENSENSDEGEGDKPKTKYVAEPLKAQDYSEYSKMFNLNINNLFLYNKKDKKYVSKGSGFFSIEKTKDEKSEKHQAVVVFRNHAGNKLVEGFLDKAFNKFDILSKDFNCVVCFGIIMIKDGKPEIGFIKIPFKSENNANELKKYFDEAMEFIGKK